MKYCLYYWIFEPLKGELLDTPERIPSFEIPVKYKYAEYLFSLFCDDNNIPEFAKIKISPLCKDEIPSEILPLLQSLKEHLLSTLKLTYQRNILLFSSPIWSFFNEGEPYRVHLSFSYNNTPKEFNGKEVKNFFTVTFPYKEAVRLLIDGTDEAIPLEYRYLSLYKIIEHEFKISGEWEKNKLQEFLDLYKDLFKEQGFEGKPVAILHKLRDKCAHIKTGKTKDQMGATHLNHKEIVKVNKLLPILKKICMDLVNVKAGGSFLIGSI